MKTDVTLVVTAMAETDMKLLVRASVSSLEAAEMLAREMIGSLRTDASRSEGLEIDRRDREAMAHLRPIERARSAASLVQVTVREETPLHWPKA